MTTTPDPEPAVDRYIVDDGYSDIVRLPADRPVIVVDPAVAFGRPQIRGVSTDAIAGMVWAGESPDAVASGYGLTRHEVLLACWHEGLQGAYQKQWRAWANTVHGALGGWEPLDVDALPEPPDKRELVAAARAQELHEQTACLDGGQAGGPSKRKSRRSPTA